MRLAQADWDQMAAGPYPHEYSPLPEMYCVWPKGETAGWHEPATHWRWREDRHWRVESRGDRRSLRQVMAFTENLNSLLVKGDTAWRDYTVTADLSAGRAARMVGLVFRYADAFNFYAAAFTDGRLQLVRKLRNGWTVLAAAPCRPPARQQTLAVRCRGNRFAVTLDGTKRLTAADPSLPEGKAGVIAATPAVFFDFHVDASPAEARRVALAAAAVRRRAALARRRYSPMRLWKEVRFGDYVGGKGFRFGDLAGKGGTDIVVWQMRDQEIVCLTAVDFDGNVLWQHGRPVADPVISTTDGPVQIVDFDGRGRNDVLAAFGGEFVLLDGATGRPRRRGPLPVAPPRDETAAHVGGTSWFGDCIRPHGSALPPTYVRACNLTGRSRGFDFICGYHYPWLFGYDNRLRPRWRYTGNVGHFATTYDVDGDGKDEILAGYSFLRGDGAWQFSLHLGDHADAVAIMPHNHPLGEGRLTFVAAAGEDGLLLFDDRGWFQQIVKGHVQRLSIGKYRKDLPGLQYAVVTYHGNPGVYTIYDRSGFEIFSREMPCAGSNLQPVNWSGDGEELILFSGHREIGGLMNAHGDIVVEFPDRDHPQLWCEAINLCGDERDEILVFDRERLRVYTPAEPFLGDRIYAPLRPPLWNWSNFMAHYSYPAWKTLRSGAGGRRGRFVAT